MPLCLVFSFPVAASVELEIERQSHPRPRPPHVLPWPDGPKQAPQQLSARSGWPGAGRLPGCWVPCEVVRPSISEELGSSCTFHPSPAPFCVLRDFVWPPQARTLPCSLVGFLRKRETRLFLSPQLSITSSFSPLFPYTSLL